MSGLEPLVALGVASNVMQIISFAGDCISACRRICESGSPEPCLDDYSKRLSDVSTNLRKRLSQTKGPLANDTKALIAVAEKCTDAAQALRIEIASLSAQQRHRGFGEAVLLAVKSRMRKNRLKRLEHSLDLARNTMESHLLVQMTKTIDSTSLLQHEAFENLDHELQHFVRQFVNGHKSLSELVVRETVSIKLHVSKETANIQDSVKAHVSGELEKSQETIARHMDNATGHMQDTLLCRLDSDTAYRLRKRLLGSLKYVGMNERTNSISEAYPKTFSWLFRSQESDSQAKGDQKLDQASVDDAVGSEIGTMDDSADVTPVSSAEEIGPNVSSWADFTDWLSSDQSMYWISGKPASGKSTLMNFILSHPDTLPLLRKWRPKVSLLSHFFWKAGGILQKNIKGMLCSLVYQIFDNDDNLANKYMMTIKGLQHKDSEVDWGIDELRRLLFDCLGRTDRSFCIFMDGLDEVEPEMSMFNVMRLIEQLHASNQVKICLSSRPEQVFENHFGRFPSLRLQDLTASDIKDYTIGTLHPDLRSHASLVASITTNAEGVFLWAVLATDSLNKGFENGDSRDLLVKRLESMPSALTNLYRDMWSRLGEDQGLYRQYVSLYLQIILCQRTLLRVPQFRYDQFKGMTALQLTVASCDVVRNSLFKKRATLGSIDVQNHCANTVRILKVACGGFLTVIQKDRGMRNLGHASYDALMPYMDMQVEFIHRTAYDFLITTEEGQDLQKACHMSVDDKYTRIFEAYLAETPIWSWLFNNSSVWPKDRMWYISAGLLDSFMESLSEMRRELSEQALAWLLGTLQEYSDRGHLATAREVALAHQTRQGMFWASVGTYGFAEYASSRLEETGPHDFCGLSMLLNACRHSLDRIANEEPGRSEGCLRIIQNCLKSRIPPCSILDESKETSPWLCFLAHVLEFCTFEAELEELCMVPKPNILDIIRTFIETGADLDDTTRVVWNFHVREAEMVMHISPLSAAFCEAARGLPSPFVVLEVNASSLIRAILRLMQKHVQITSCLGHEETPPKQKVVMFSAHISACDGIARRPLLYAPGSPQDCELLLNLVTPWALKPYGPFKNVYETDEVTRPAAREVNKVLNGLIPSSTLVGDMSHAANEWTREGLLSERFKWPCSRTPRTVVLDS